MATLPTDVSQFQVLSILHEQHCLCIIDFQRNHRGLVKQHKKLEKLDNKIRQMHGEKLSRRQRRKLYLSRILTVQNIINISSQQAAFQGLLRQYQEVISAYDLGASPTLSTPWMAHLPVAPYDMISTQQPSTMLPMVFGDALDIMPQSLCINVAGSQADSFELGRSLCYTCNGSTEAQQDTSIDPQQQLRMSQFCQRCGSCTSNSCLGACCY